MGDETPQAAIQPEFAIGDPDHAPSTYANFLAIWHTAHEFTLDFAQMEPAVIGEGGTSATIPCRLTARVKIPPSVVFEVIRALNENMTRYEEVFGPIPQPGVTEPLYPPEDIGTGEDDDD